MPITPLEVTAGIGVLGGGVGVTGAVLAYRAALKNLRQKVSSDDREAWWKRAQWAIDLSMSADPQQRQVGTDAMRVLADDPTATRTDLDVLDAALVRALAR